MPPSGSQGYDALPPIPSYDEAIADLPPRSPTDGRPTTETEHQSLLRNPGSGPSSRRPGGYRQPTVESDDESDAEDWSSTSDSEAAEVRREMQEFDIEEPNTTASRWGKRISQWSWKWRLRMPNMPNMRLPNLRRTDPPPDPEPGTSTGGQQGAAAEESSAPTPWWGSTFPANLPLPQMNRTTVLLLVARMAALTLLLGFFYLLFVSDMLSGMARRMNSRAFPPELLREHIQKTVDARRMRDTLREFTSYAHIAGTEGDFGLAEDVERLFNSYGLEEVSITEYYTYLNYPTSDGRAVHILEGDDKEKIKWTAKLEEAELGGEKAGHQTYVFHGYSKSGDVAGPLVYANYGSQEDFQKLKEDGVKTEGAVALVRYYGHQPNLALKVRAAEEAGFVGCIVYSDPADDGFVKGQVAPNGRFMPTDGVQRGSVAAVPWVIGDPLTPGWESTKDLPRMTIDEAPGLPHIPSLPLAWRDAHDILKALEGVGKEVESEWSGGIPDLTYWTGNETSPLVRLVNQNDEVEKQPVWNVLGKVIGTEQHHKAIIIGNHRDAWATGATGPGSGTAVWLEIARIFGGLRMAGWRPRRSIIFTSWDAKEYNMVGSTEFVEHHIENLRKDGYVYINLDSAVSGDTFHASGSPIFHLPLLHALNRVADPHFNTSLRHLWDEGGSKIYAPTYDSDLVPFLALAGMSSVDLSFGSDERYPLHSSYDNFHWMENVGDPRFVYHNLLAQVVGLLTLELSNKPILPFDLAAYPQALERWVDDLAQWAKEKGSGKAGNKFAGFNGMVDAVKHVAAMTKGFEAWAQSWENKVMGAGGWESNLLGEQRFEYNTQMAEFETALLDLEKGGGLPDRTQFKHVVYGPQKWSAYEDAFFPGIRDAIEEGNWALANELVEKTARILRKAGDGLAMQGKDKTKRWWLW